MVDNLLVSHDDNDNGKNNNNKAKQQPPLGTTTSTSVTTAGDRNTKDRGGRTTRGRIGKDHYQHHPRTTGVLFSVSVSESESAQPSKTNPKSSGQQEDQQDEFELQDYPQPKQHHTADTNQRNLNPSRDRAARREEKKARKRRWLDAQDEMKFSHSIQFNAVPDWSTHYIAYSNLKKL